MFHLPVSLYYFYFNTGHRHIFRVLSILANKAKLCHFFVTLPTPFLITFLLTQQVID